MIVDCRFGSCLACPCVEVSSGKTLNATLPEAIIVLMCVCTCEWDCDDKAPCAFKKGSKVLDKCTIYHIGIHHLPKDIFKVL